MKSKNHNTHLLIIDPQNDFCDLPEHYVPVNPVTGESLHASLPVAGAHLDMQRVAAIIKQGGKQLNAISITLDSHHRIDIAHPAFWVDTDGNTVPPFTQISAQSVRDGRYRTKITQNQTRALAYLDALEKSGRYQHMVWPVHCEMGTWGHNVHSDVQSAYSQWEEETNHSVNKVQKGRNPWTEHYSAIRAEVPDANDPETEINAELIALLRQSDYVYITGEAGSHCVKATTEHIVECLGDVAAAEKLVIVTDCMSPVTGFEAQHQSFLSDMASKGIRFLTSDQVIVELNNLN